MKHWTDAHIWTTECCGLTTFVGDDEGGSPLYASTDRDEVVRRLEAYAKTLEERSLFSVAASNPSGPSGPFRDAHLTLGVLDAVNSCQIEMAIEHARRANPEMTYNHAEDFVLYLMED